VIGTVYVLALVLVNLAALSLHRENTFGVFHALAVVSLATIAVGLLPLLFGMRSPMAIANHAYWMTWSYAGLVAAGCGQLTVAVGQEGGAWVIPATISTVLAVSGVVIFGRVPSILSACRLSVDRARGDAVPLHLRHPRSGSWRRGGWN
jgi:hypothetical protein